MVEHPLCGTLREKTKEENTTPSKSFSLQAGLASSGRGKAPPSETLYNTPLS